MTDEVENVRSYPEDEGGGSRPPVVPTEPPISLIARAAAASARATVSRGPESSPTAEPVRVLLVDDDPETSRGLSRALSGMDYRVEVAHGGAKALDAMRSKRFDVVVSDIGMPDMDGFELLHAIRRVDTQVPVVLLTGEPTVSTAARALEVGAFRYVTKPVSATDLSGVVEKAAQLHRMARIKEQAAELLGHHAPQGTDHAFLRRSFDKCLSTLWVAFQPILDARTRTIFGYECLMRSREPELPHPGAVLDAAERLDDLSTLGRRVRALAAAAIPGAVDLPAIFVNLHVRDLLDDTLLDPDSPLSPFASQIILEVTERASLAEVSDVRQRIAELRSVGFRIAVDDLGAGYAGLTSFALLEPEFVKLDMSLIRDIHSSPTKRKVVRSMVNLAQDMGMLVVGEGVECAEERDTLVDLGCDFLQGYLFARPGPPFPEARF